MLSFLTVYEEKSTKFQEEISTICAKIVEIDQEIAVLSKNLAELQPKKEKVQYQRYIYNIR